jgi:hypothetical protein
MNKKLAYSSLILFLFCLPISGQNYVSPTNYSLSARYSKGFILAHHQSFHYFIKGHVPAFELSLIKKATGAKTWHHVYKFPETGFGYSYTDLGNPGQLGHANALFAIISLPATTTKMFKLSYRASGGVAWVSKRFDLYHNVYNIAIGSKLNAYLYQYLDTEFRLDSKWNAVIGIGLTHFSNGGTQQPNRGLNIFSLQAGLRYQLTEKEERIVPDSLPAITNKNEFSLIYSIGVKTLEPAQRKKYFTSSISVNASRQISHKHMFGIGLDIFKDNSRKEYLLKEKILNPHGADLFYAGGHFSYDLIFGKTSFTVQMGSYFWQRSKHFEEVYHRFGLRYRFSDHWMASLTLKTYWAAADFAEWGLGYKF